MNDKKEYFIKGRKNRKFPLYAGMIMILALVISTAAFMFMGFTAIFITLVVCGLAFYGIYVLYCAGKLEYEFSFELGELQISEIRNQAKRKVLFKSEIKEIGSITEVSKQDAIYAEKHPVSGIEIYSCYGDDEEEIFMFSGKNTVSKNKEISGCRIYVPKKVAVDLGFKK